MLNKKIIMVSAENGGDSSAGNRWNGHPNAGSVGTFFHGPGWGETSDASQLSE